MKVNGETVPLFSVNSGQIDAQMPWEVQGGTIASVVVTNGSTTSNAAAIYVPAGATPGISFYSTNRAVVVDASQGSSINSASSPAAVGDVVVVYFTGGGPVQLPASAKLTTGAYPTGSWPAAGTSSITIGTVPVTQINYIGLSTGGVGLYQTNFVIPQIAKGTYPLVITIGGQANTVGAGISQPVLTISN